MTPTQLTEQELAATDVGEYKYGFHDQVTSVFRTRRGLDEKVVREISAHKSRARRIASARNSGGCGRGIETPLQGGNPQRQ
jgi:hypothetical protein